MKSSHWIPAFLQGESLPSGFRALTPFSDLLELELVHLPRLVACRGWEFSHRSWRVMRGPRSPKAASLSHGKVSSRRRAVSFSARESSYMASPRQAACLEESTLENM